MGNPRNNPPHSEQEFLASYRMDQYERPSVTADIVVFSLREEKGSSYRSNHQQKLSLLLIRRGEHPFRDCWALPGGFLRKGETIEQCAYREIREETGVSPSVLFPIGVFSHPDRDPRGWILSNAFASILPQADVLPYGGDDAADACWFDVQTEEADGKLTITLTKENDTMKLLLQETGKCFGISRYEILESGGLAFDHARIIAQTFSVFRKEAQSYQLALDFLPEAFPLSQFQAVYETLCGTSLAPANFRRMVMPLLDETEEYAVRAGHRPARLYKRKEPSI